MQEKILTPDQVSQILQVHPFTVLKFIKQGRLKASKLGRVYRIRESDLEGFLDQTSAKSSKTEEESPNIIKKSKNKNKTSLIKQIELKEPTEPIPEPKITVTQVDMVETGENSVQHGGDDEYFILQ
jgi:excisionase family DNA binding protein